jgi:hypothetical protein
MIVIVAAQLIDCGMGSGWIPPRRIFDLVGGGSPEVFVFGAKINCKGAPAFWNKNRRALHRAG